jgi:chromosome segregation ATPase
MQEQIDKLNEEFKEKKAELHLKKSQMFDGQQGRNPIRQALKEHFNELNHFNAEKKEKLVLVDAIDKEISVLDKERAQELKKVHPIYNTPDKLKSGLKELNRRLTQTTLAKNDEMRVIKEIEQV